MARVFDGEFAITIRFGERYRFSFDSPFAWLNGRRHDGVDWAMPVSTPLLPPVPCRVTDVRRYQTGHGLHQRLESLDKQWRFLYAHLSEIRATVGREVSPDTVSALSGGARGMFGAGSSKGPHLHFEMFKRVAGGYAAVDFQQLKKAIVAFAA